MRRTITLLIIVLTSLPLFAEDAAVEFTADRPGESTGAATVGRGVVQWEQGIKYDGDGGAGVFTFSNTLLRYGLFDGVELRVGGDAFVYSAEESCKAAFSGLSVGAKIACYEGRGAIPAISLLLDLAIPATGTREYAPQHLAPSLYLLFDNPIGERLNIGYNVGAEWGGEQLRPNLFLALCVGYSITDDLGTFVESYNTLAPGNNFYGIDCGFNYMLSRKVQIDIAANIDVCNPSRAWAVSAGVAWQINK